MTAADGDPILDVFQVIVRYETIRRCQEGRRRKKSLAEFEREYHGVEVGYVRRAINRTVNEVFDDPEGKSLLDYGCGGPWWKEAYWPRFRRVVAVDVNEEDLEQIAREYPGSNVELGLTKNGLIDCDERFDYVLSSSVVGYIHPRQADAHLRSCYRLLAPGGTLVLSRVRAHNLGSWVRGSRFQAVPEFSFSYAYTKKELLGALMSIGFRSVRYLEHGVWFPFSSKLNQQLFRFGPRMMQVWGPRVFPFFRFQHMCTAVR